MHRLMVRPSNHGSSALPVRFTRRGPGTIVRVCPVAQRVVLSIRPRGRRSVGIGLSIAAAKCDASVAGIVVAAVALSALPRLPCPRRGREFLGHAVRGRVEVVGVIAWLAVLVGVQVDGVRVGVTVAVEPVPPKHEEVVFIGHHAMQKPRREQYVCMERRQRRRSSWLDVIRPRTSLLSHTHSVSIPPYLYRT